MLYIIFVMNIELKLAWLNVFVISLTLALFVVIGLSVGYLQAFGAFGLLGFLGLTPFLYRKNSDASACDERDLAVAKKASLVAGMFSYAAVVLGGMLIWFFHYFNGKEFISVHYLPGLVTLAAVVLLLIRSLFIISQYSSKALGSNE